MGIAVIGKIHRAIYAYVFCTPFIIRDSIDSLCVGTADHAHPFSPKLPNAAYAVIIESVDSICRDGTDTPIIVLTNVTA